MTAVDIHTHILPEIDDGAKSVNESKEMLILLKQQGITDVCFTPHYDARCHSLSDFVEKRQKAYLSVKNICDEIGINGHLAAEVKLYRNIFNYSDISSLCVEGSNYLLTEFPFEDFGEDYLLNMLFKLQADYSVVPIIVHPERYKKLYNARFLNKLCFSDCLVQADISALEGMLMRRKTLNFIDSGLIDFIASDCHNTSSRAPEFFRAKEILGEERYNKLMSESRKIFFGNFQ